MAAEDPHLFDPGPAIEQPKQDLYVAPRKTGKAYSHDENVRVRALFKDHITQRAQLQQLQPARHEHALGLERGAFVRDLVALAEREQVRYYEGRKPDHAKGADAAADSVRTQLRQFWTGSDLPDYVLVLVEATMCDRKGMALPGAFYGLQRRMPGAE